MPASQLVGMLAAIQPVLGFLPLIPFAGPILFAVIGGTYAVFLTGYGELRDPLERMGTGKLGAIRLSAKYFPTTFAMGLSKITSEPVPLLGGLVQAAESLGCITIARAILEKEKAIVQE